MRFLKKKKFVLPEYLQDIIEMQNHLTSVHREGNARSALICYFHDSTAATNQEWG